MKYPELVLTSLAVFSRESYYHQSQPCLSLFSILCMPMSPPGCHPSRKPKGLNQFQSADFREQHRRKMRVPGERWGFLFHQFLVGRTVDPPSPFPSLVPCVSLAQAPRDRTCWLAQDNLSSPLSWEWEPYPRLTLGGNGSPKANLDISDSY